MNGKTIRLLVALALVSSGCGRALIKAVKNKDSSEIDRLLTLDAVNVNKSWALDNDGFTALYFASGEYFDAEHGMATIEKLWAKGANPGHGLAGASEYNRPKLAAYFLEKGAKPRSYYLVRALRNSYEELAAILISHGVDVGEAREELEDCASRAARSDGRRRSGNCEEGIRLLDALSADSASINRLARRASKLDPAEEKAFEAEAARYRSLAVKPSLPEAARRFKIQAEAAVRKKEFDRAAERYVQALEIAPWWPEGRYNRALILAELGLTTEAAREMKRYLKLVPDAADARRAQDKIYEWEDK